MQEIQLRTQEEIERQIAWNIQRILQTQNSDGMIPSSIEYVDKEIRKKKDLPRQAFATMALSFASTLVRKLSVIKQIQSSTTYILDNLEGESAVDTLYIHMYLALSKVYARVDPTSHIQALQEVLNKELYTQPIALGLYLRLSWLLPKPLPHTAYIAEVVRYRTSMTPRSGRFFDFADTLVWGAAHDPVLAKREKLYLLKYKTKDNWFSNNNGSRSSASVVGKMFEVLAYQPDNIAFCEALYTTLLQQRATSQFAKDTLGEYAEHILAEPNTLKIDDVHSHILVGLCYRYGLVAEVSI